MVADKRLAGWLDTTGRKIAENPFNPWSSSVLALSLYPVARRFPGVYPRPAHLLLFGGAFGLSGYMNFAGYPVDGSGTMAAWSMLYLLVNRWRRTVGPVYRAKAVGPLLLGGKVGFDFAVHGFYFFSTDRPEEEQ